MSELLTAKQQIASVARRYPQLAVLARGPQLVIWEGPLAGFSRQYRIRIFWHRWLDDDSLRLHTALPRVLVREPALLPRGGEPVPHRYPSEGALQRICCFDPAADDWDETKPMGETLVPFIEQWLCSYELWRISGEWPAPGRHPELDLCTMTIPGSATSSLDQPERFLAAASVKVGRLMGTFASSALMAVASEASYRWPRLRDWNGTIWAGNRSPAASTSSLELPLAESLRSVSRAA